MVIYFGNLFPTNLYEIRSSGDFILIFSNLTKNFPNQHFFNFQIITYESPREGVTVITKKEETTTSFLLIKNAKPSDSGVYQCNPSNAKSKSVTVHVLNGKFSTKNTFYFYI